MPGIPGGIPGGIPAFCCGLFGSPGPPGPTLSLPRRRSAGFATDCPWFCSCCPSPAISPMYVLVGPVFFSSWLFFWIFESTSTPFTILMTRHSSLPVIGSVYRFRR